jgi:NAD-dependent deacetylase
MSGTPDLPPQLVERLGERPARAVGAITGAGISRESGIPTYRGRGGIYDDPAEGERTVESLSGSTLATDPDRTWRAIAGLARAAAGAEPNAAHRALVEIESRVERFVLLTQNVDRLHQRAGSRNVIDIHGDVFATRCLACSAAGRLETHELARLERTPRCTRCAGPLRPDAVLFEELLPPDKVQRLHDEFYRRPPEVVIVAGTSAMFPYVTEPVVQARHRGNLTIEINPEPTALSEVVHHSLRGPAGVLLPALARALAT